MCKPLLRRQEGFELTCREGGAYGAVGTLCFSSARTTNRPVAYSTQEIGSRYKPTQSFQLSHHITPYIYIN